MTLHVNGKRGTSIEFVDETGKPLEAEVDGETIRVKLPAKPKPKPRKPAAKKPA